MTLDDLDKHLIAMGKQIEMKTVGSDVYTVIKGFTVSNGNTYDVGVKRNTGTPWLPESALHVRPHRVPMGESASQVSALGDEWQYLSRRFERTPTAQSFIAHILTVLQSP
jgi:hypothetical protein